MSDLNRSIKLFIDGSDATNNVEKVKESIARLEQKLKSLNTSEKDYAAKSKKLKDELSSKNRSLQNYQKQLEATTRVLNNLSGASYDELVAISSKVRKELRAALPGTQQYTAALEQNRRVTEALVRAQTAMRVEVGCQGTVWGRASNFVNKYIGLAGAAAAAITGVSMKLNQLRETRNKREEAKADVEALTGLDKESIDWLEQQAIRLSTKMTESGIRIRQSATEILDAYKLVGSAKPELLKDKEALAEVTEQTLILASASGMSLKDAVDAVTLSLNQYGDGANQASRYTNVVAAGSKYGAAAVQSITTAVTKSGVAAASAKVPIEQLVGTIETLGEKGIKDEIAGTGLKKFFLTLQTGADETNPAIVGLDKALDNLQKKQLSAAQIKKMFGEEGYNVASILINEADKVKYYTEAVTGTSVAMEQAATKSDTAAAKLDQAKNKMQEMGIQLMEKLNPAFVSIAGSTASWTSKLISLLDFLTRHKGTITALIIGYSSYLIVSKSVVLWNKRIATSFNTIGKAIKKNPWGLILTVATAIIGAFIEMKQKSDELANTLTGMKKVNRETTTSFVEQESKIRSLTSTINDNGKSLDVRRTALNELKKIIPGYNAMISDEGVLTSNNTQAIKDYLVQLEKEIKLKAAREELEELYKKKGQLEKDEAAQSDTYWDIRQQNILQGYDHNKLTSKLSRLFGMEKEDNAKNVLDKTRKELADTTEQIEELFEFIGSSDIVNAVTNEASEAAKLAAEAARKAAAEAAKQDKDNKSKKALKKKLETENKIYHEHQNTLKEMFLEGNDETLQTEKQFNAEMECLELEHQQRIIKIAGSKSKEGIEAQNRINDLRIKQQKEYISRQLEEEKQTYERQQADLKQIYVSGNDENLKTEKDYNEAMEQLTIMHLQRVLQIANLDTEQRRAIEKQLLDFKVKCLQDEEAERKKYQDKEQKKKDALAKREKQRLQEQAQQYRQYGEQIGETIGQMLTYQEDALQNFADAMIDILFDVLSQMIDIEIAKATGVAVGAVARASAESFAQPDSVLTFGASGAARAAVLSGLIMGALAAAKSALKGLIHKGGSSSGSGDTDSQKTAQVVVKQWASGRYDVIGQDDGKTYRDIPYIGDAPTGIVHRTSLVSENGAELIINAKDLARLQHHINYPVVVQAIQDARIGRVSQRAAGNYESLHQPIGTSSGISNNETSNKALESVVQELKLVISALKNLKAYVVLRDLQEAKDLDAKSKEPFTRKTK